MNELIAVSTGLFAGTITGIVPGAGVMVAMIVASPLLMHFDEGCNAFHQRPTASPPSS